MAFSQDEFISALKALGLEAGDKVMLYQDTGDSRYLEAGRALNRYVRRTVRIDGDYAVRGAVKGAFPVSGGYGEYEYLNWAVKFTIDSNLLEQSIVSRS